LFEPLAANQHPCVATGLATCSAWLLPPIPFQPSRR